MRQKLPCKLTCLVLMKLVARDKRKLCFELRETFFLKTNRFAKDALSCLIQVKNVKVCVELVNSCLLHCANFITKKLKA